MTHPTLEDAARALAEADIRDKRRWDTTKEDLERIMPSAVDFCWREYLPQVRLVLLSIRPPDREDLPLRQLEARDYIDGVLNG